MNSQSKSQSQNQDHLHPHLRPQLASRIFGITGGSGSGKTTFAKALQKTLGSDFCVILAQDSYYIDQSAKFRGDGENVNFDHPSAVDFPLLAEHLRDLKAGKSVQVPIYDFVTHTRKKETQLFSPKPWILLDGTMILSQSVIRPELEDSIFIDAPEAVRFERRLNRDVRERGRQPEGVRKQFFNQVKPMHDEFIEGSKPFAGHLLSGLRPFEEAVELWAVQLKTWSRLLD